MTFPLSYDLVSTGSQYAKRFVKILGTYTEGKHLDDEGMKDIIVYRQAKKVEVVAPEGFAYSLDGEIIYENKFTIEIAKDAVNFAAPE